MNLNKDLGRILAKGSPMQRINLLWNHRTEVNFEMGNGFLSDAEELALFDSFKKPEETRLYNRYLHLYQRLQNGFMTLQQFYLIYLATVEKLRGFALFDITRTKVLVLVNDLYFGTKGKEEKRRILGTLEAHNGFILFKIEPGPMPNEDGIRAVDFEGCPFREITSTLYEKAKRELSQAKAAVMAIREVMEETGFQIKIFQDRLDYVAKDLREDKAPFPRYSKRQTMDALGLSAAPLYRDVWIFPAYEDVEPDLVFKEKLKKDHLV